MPGHSFLLGNYAADKLTRRGALLGPSATPCSLSLPSYLSYPLFFFSRTGGVLSHRSILTHRFAQFPPGNLCSLVTLAVFSLVYAATDTAYCSALILLGLAESRIFPAAHADTRHRTPLISFCTVQLWTLCVDCSLETLCLSTTSGPDPGELPGFWGSVVFRHALIPRKGSGNQQQQQQEVISRAKFDLNSPSCFGETKSTYVGTNVH